MSTFQSWVGKTVVAIAVSDENTELYFMFSDGTAQYIPFRLNQNGRYGYAIGISGLRSIKGVASFLHNAITSVQNAGAPDPTGVIDGYESLSYNELTLHTASHTLTVGYALNAGMWPVVPSVTEPIGTGLITADWTPPIFARENDFR